MSKTSCPKSNGWLVIEDWNQDWYDSESEVYIFTMNPILKKIEKYAELSVSSTTIMPETPSAHATRTCHSAPAKGVRLTWLLASPRVQPHIYFYLHRPCVDLFWQTHSERHSELLLPCNVVLHPRAYSNPKRDPFCGDLNKNDPIGM